MPFNLAKFLKRGLLAGILLVLVAYSFMNYRLYRSIYSPHNKTICCETPADWGLDYKAISFTGGDQVTLQGWYISPHNGIVIILLHGYHSHRLTLKELAKSLANHGYGVLMYDMRGHGESQHSQRSYGWRDPADVQGAVNFLSHYPEIEHLGIYGHSVGGQVAVRAAAQLPELEVVVLDGVSSAFYDDVDALREHNLKFRLVSYDLFIMNRVSAIWLGMDIPEGIKASLPKIAPRPILLLGGLENPVEALMIPDFYNAANEPKLLITFEDMGHGDMMQEHPQEYNQLVIQFYDSAFAEITTP